MKRRTTRKMLGAGMLKPERFAINVPSMNAGIGRGATPSNLINRMHQPRMKMPVIHTSTKIDPSKVNRTLAMPHGIESRGSVAFPNVPSEPLSAMGSEEFTHKANPYAWEEPPRRQLIPRGRPRIYYDYPWSRRPHRQEQVETRHTTLGERTDRTIQKGVELSRRIKAMRRKTAEQPREPKKDVVKEIYEEEQREAKAQPALAPQAQPSREKEYVANENWSPEERATADRNWSKPISKKVQKAADQFDETFGKKEGYSY